MAYSLQSNGKTGEGGSHLDRNAQFEHINETVKMFHESGLSAISVDTKKRENIGISKDTAEFAVNSIKTWWHETGKAEYSHAGELLITADCGGSNGCRVKLRKIEPQKFANETGMLINIYRFPPGTSKWN